jgi:peptidoglycan/LPS O-acetylase OafA/YrhL
MTETSQNVIAVALAPMPLIEAETSRLEVPAAISKRTASRYYQPELDSLRFLAFLGVFFYHAAPTTPDSYSVYSFLPKSAVLLIRAAFGAGAFGVDLFFALSAYLITVLLIREKSLRGHIDVKAFYARRILRIWPIYFLFIAVAVVASGRLQSQQLRWPYIVGYLLLAGNWVYVFKGLPASIAVPLWSISVEEQFYLCWPLVLRKVTSRQLIYGAVVLLMVGNLSRFILVACHVKGAAVEYNTFARIDAIAFGILVACFLGDRAPNLSLKMRLGLLLSALASWVTIAMFTRLDSPNQPAPILGTLIGRPLVAFSAAMILISFIGAASSVPPLSSSVLTYLGRISYGLYVYHLAGLVFAQHFLQGRTATGYAVVAAFALLLTIGASAISYRWIESPFLRLKNRFTVVQSRSI